MSAWFAEHRIAWIIEASSIYGYINRGHIQRKFGVSTPQASTDLKVAQQRHPGALVYDPSAKCYRYCAAPTRRGVTS